MQTRNSSPKRSGRNWTSSAAAHYGDDPRQERGSAIDVGGAYNTSFLTIKRAGPRTSMIVDPPNGRMPPQTPEAQRAAAADREFFLALLQATDACKNKEPVCAGGKYDPTLSPRFAEPPPRYHAGNVARLNRSDGPEDDGLADRCLRSGLPEFGSLFGGSFRRIVQTPGGISIFYDVNQGQGWQRNIVMNGSPHLPAGIRQWFGDSRGHWEGDTLVIDVTNFSPEDRCVRVAREPAPRRALDAHRAEDARVRGHDRGSDGVDAAVDRQAGVQPGRATRRTGSTTSRAASRATTACRDCCTDGASRSAPSPRDAAPIREPRTASARCCRSRRIRCSSVHRQGLFAQSITGEFGGDIGIERFRRGEIGAAAVEVLPGAQPRLAAAVSELGWRGLRASAAS